MPEVDAQNRIAQGYRPLGGTQDGAVPAENDNEFDVDIGPIVEDAHPLGGQSVDHLCVRAGPHPADEAVFG